MRKFFVVLLFFHFACRLVSQTTVSTTLLSVNEGLSQGMIFDILQSRDGFLWIATKDGLNRYDGSRFEVFSPDPFNPFAIGGSEVQTLFEDSRGWLWVSLPDGLDVLDPVSGRFFHLMHEGKPILGKTNESKLIETPDGTIWFSVYDRIWKVNPPKDMLANAAKQGNANIELPCQPILMSAVSGWSGGQLQPGQLLFTQKQKLLVGTNNGLFRLDPSTGQVLPELPISGFSVRLMVENAKGELLMKGVIPSSLRQWVWITGSGAQFFTDPSIKYSAASFIFDPAGFLWTFRDRSIQKWGVPALFNQGKPELEIKADSIFSNDRAYCTKVMFDKSGVCWVGTNGYGVFKINQKVPKFKTFLPQDSHRLLLEAPAGGLVSLEKPRIKYPSKAFASWAVHTDFYTDLPFDKIAIGRLAVCFDAAGNGWSSFRSDSLLYRMDAVTKARKSFPWHGEGLLLDRNGNPAQCSFTVTKVDNTPPTITCPATQTLVLGANCTATLPNYASLATTGDNCGVQGVTQSPEAGTTVSGTGKMTVTLTVTDVNGLANSCTLTVTKMDETPPTVVCKNTTVFLNAAGNYTLQAADVFNAAASSDNCSGVLTVTNISLATVSCAQIGQTIPVTVTVQDGAGNSATCTAQITVQEGLTLPGGWSSNDVGNANGSGGYKPCTTTNGQFTVSATGFSTSSMDVLHLTSRQLCGNGEFIARVANVSGGGWGGITLRESLAPGSKLVALKTQGTNNIRRMIRTTTNGAVNNLNLFRQHTWFRLVRNGSNFVAYTSFNGVSWDFAFSATISMAECIYAGIFAESINVNTTTTATFDNVQLIGGTLSLMQAPQTPAAAPNFSLEVYPNPTTGEVNVDLSAYANPIGAVKVFDAYGKLVIQNQLDGSPLFRMKLDGDDGVYFLSIEVEGEAPVTKRVVIAH
jgi:hypothetical protein